MPKKKKEPGKRPPHWKGRTRKWKGNEDQCPVCGLKYKNLSTEFTFKEIHDMLWVGTPDYSQWKYKRRRTVLGLWHQIKMSLWDQHLKGCEKYQMYKEAQEQYESEFNELVDVVRESREFQDRSDIPF